MFLNNSYVLARASASLTVRTEIGLGTIYKFVGAIYTIEISILTEKRQIQEGGCHTCGTVQRAAEQPAHGTMFFPSFLTAVCGRGWKCSMVWWKRASRKCRKAQRAFPALASNETWMCDMAGIHHVVGEKLWFATRIAQIDWVMVAFMSWKKSHVQALKLFHRLETCNVFSRSARCRVQQWTR